MAKWAPSNIIPMTLVFYRKRKDTAYSGLVLGMLVFVIAQMHYESNQRLWLLLVIDSATYIYAHQNQFAS